MIDNAMFEVEIDAYRGICDKGKDTPFTYSQCILQPTPEDLYNAQNELAGTQYHLDIGKILEGVDVNKLFAFDGADDTQKEQLSSLFDLVSEAPNGTNPESGKLPSLIDCTLTSGCFADEEESLSAGFIDCYLFSGFRADPPCNNEFNAVMETVNLTEVAKCFFEDDTALGKHLSDIGSPVPPAELFETPFTGSAVPMTVHRQLQVPGQTPENTIPEGEKDDSLDLVLCLMGALLPKDAMNEITNVVNDLFGIVGVVFDVVENGLYIPGDLILFVFGWAEYTDADGFVAPYKWYYCMFAVAVFLMAIELFKLFAVRFIVWTKR